jgi:farnesyl-diphosphate farnesyltransferase
MHDRSLPDSLLRDVSRSFHLTLRVLPAAVRRPMGLAYLLARTTDTIADTAVLPAALRLEALASLRAKLRGASSAPLQFEPFLQNQSLPAERSLLQWVEASLDALNREPPRIRALIQDVLDVITGGQELDLQRFGSLPSGTITALCNDAELDDYTWRVAGCVGRFWTLLCRQELFPRESFELECMIADGIRFGKGLQLINILRDLPADLRLGRCYLPQDRLEEISLQPADLLDANTESRLRPLYDHYLQLAHSHLTAGWQYTCRLPHSQTRVRLACAWPILIGARTLARLAREPVLSPNHRVKVTRAEVRSILFRSFLLLPSRTLWQRQFTGILPSTTD